MLRPTKNLNEQIDKEILENLKKDNPWSLDFKNAWNNYTPEERQNHINEIIKKFAEWQKIIDEQKAAEPDGFLTDKDGRLLQLLGKATLHDWVVWYNEQQNVNNIKKRERNKQLEEL